MILLSIYLRYFVTVSFLVSTGSCLQVESLVTVKEGFRAKGTVLQSKQTSSQLDCAHFCFRKEGCLSFNYKLSSKTKGLCELLSDTAGHFDVSQLVNRVGWMHGQIVPFVQNRDKDAPAQCKTWRTQDGGCCVFPFIYQGSPRESCVFDGQSWCSLTENYDLDKLKGTCEDFNVTFTTLGAKGRGGPTKATGYRGTTLQDKVKLERGGAGGGLFGDGESGGSAEGGKSFQNGGEGGKSPSGSNGGFGGGGAGMKYPGAGGGYSGGSVFMNTHKTIAGGGGSLNRGANQVKEDGANEGHGRVTITLVL